MRLVAQEAVSAVPVTATFEHRAVTMILAELSALTNQIEPSASATSRRRPSSSVSISLTAQLSPPERARTPAQTVAMLRARSCPLATSRSEEHTSELQSRGHLVCRLLLEKKKKKKYQEFARKQEKNHNK